MSPSIEPGGAEPIISRDIGHIHSRQRTRVQLSKYSVPWSAASKQTAHFLSLASVFSSPRMPVQVPLGRTLERPATGATSCSGCPDNASLVALPAGPNNAALSLQSRAPSTHSRPRRSCTQHSR